MTKINKTTFTKAVEKSNGTRSNVARILEVTNAGITNFLTKEPKLAGLLDEKRLSNIDKAEAEIFEELDFDEDEKPGVNAKIRQTAALAILKTLGANRGWQDNQKVEHSGELDSKITIIIPKEVEELLNENNKSNS